MQNVNDPKAALLAKARDAEENAARLKARGDSLKAVAERFPDVVESPDQKILYAMSVRDMADRVGYLRDPTRLPCSTKITSEGLSHDCLVGLFLYVEVDTPSGKVRVYDPTPVPEDRIDAVLSDPAVAMVPLVDAASRWRGTLLRPGDMSNCPSSSDWQARKHLVAETEKLWKGRLGETAMVVFHEGHGQETPHLAFYPSLDFRDGSVFVASMGWWEKTPEELVTSALTSWEMWRRIAPNTR